MSHATTHYLLDHLRLLARRVQEPETDRQLLERFARGRDEAAFAALVRRHGALVWQTARRVLHDRHEAEDVFQAAFLILARKAKSIRKKKSLAAWLHAVTYRLALRARTQSAKRPVLVPKLQSEKTAIEADPLAAMSARELLALLDEEMQRLPEKLRAPLVHCYFQDQTQEEAARQLACPLGTLRSRLQHGKELLRQRLLRRGVTLPAATLAAVLATGAARARVPITLMQNALTLARQASGELAASGLPESVCSLADKMEKTMLICKIKILAIVLMLCGLVLTAGWSASGTSSNDKKNTNPDIAPQKEPIAQKPTPKPKPRLDNYGDPLPEGAVQRLGSLRFRQGVFWQIAYSPNGKMIAAGGANNDIWLWERATGKLLHRLKGHKQHFGFIRFSPDCKSLASSDGSNKIFVWNLESGKKKFEMDGVAFVYSPDGKTLITGGRNRVKYSRPFYLPGEVVDDGPMHRWDVATGKELTPFGKGAPFDISADGKCIATITGHPSKDWTMDNPKYESCAILIWDRTSGKKLRRFSLKDQQHFMSGAFTPHGLSFYLVSGQGNYTWSIWHWPDTEKNPRKLPINGFWAPATAFAPDGKKVTLRKDNGICFFDPVTGKDLGHLSGAVQKVTTWNMTFSPDSKELVTGGIGNALSFWDVASKKQLPVAPGHRSAVISVGLLPSQGSILSVSEDGTIRLWDQGTGKEVRRIDNPNGRRFTSAALSPDGKLVVACDYTEKIQIWRLADGMKLRELRRAPKDRMHCVAFSPDGKLVAAVDCDTPALCVWQASTGRKLWEKTLRLKHTLINSLAFSPNGKSLAMATSIWDAKVLLFESRSGKLLREFHCATPNPKSKRHYIKVAFSADGRTLAATGPGHTIQLWEMTTGRERLRLKTSNFLDTIAFAPDGRCLAATDYDYDRLKHDERTRYNGTISLWNLSTGKIDRQIKGHRGYVTDLVFSPDGRRLASGGADTTILLWKVSPLEKKVPARLSKEKLLSLWQTFARNDARVAYKAQWQLALAVNGVAFLGTQLKPVTKPDPHQVRKWIDDLSSERFRVRTRAQAGLEKIGDMAEPALRAALKKRLTLEAHQRIELLLKKIAEPEGKHLQALRAIEVLEWNGTPAAQTVLAWLAKGVASARQTKEARDSLRRLKRRR